MIRDSMSRSWKISYLPLVASSASLQWPRHIETLVVGGGECHEVMNEWDRTIGIRTRTYAPAPAGVFAGEPALVPLEPGPLADLLA